MTVLTQNLLWAGLFLFKGAFAQAIPLPFPSPQLLAAASGAIMIKLEPPEQARGKLTLRWKIASANPSGYIGVERATTADGPYESLAVIRMDNQLGSFLDEQPIKGKSVYRIKWLTEGGYTHYSRPVQTVLAGDLSYRFYPNPVDNMLIIRAEERMDMVITDNQGKPRFTLPVQPGLQTLDVSSLEKGFYLLTLTQRETGRVITEKLVKN